MSVFLAIVMSSLPAYIAWTISIFNCFVNISFFLKPQLLKCYLSKSLDVRRRPTLVMIVVVVSSYGGLKGFLWFFRLHVRHLTGLAVLLWGTLDRLSSAGIFVQ